MTFDPVTLILTLCASAYLLSRTVRNVVIFPLWFLSFPFIHILMSTKPEPENIPRIRAFINGIATYYALLSLLRFCNPRQGYHMVRKEMMQNHIKHQAKLAMEQLFAKIKPESREMAKKEISETLHAMGAQSRARGNNGELVEIVRQEMEKAVDQEQSNAKSGKMEA